MVNSKSWKDTFNMSTAVSSFLQDKVPYPNTLTEFCHLVRYGILDPWPTSYCFFLLAQWSSVEVETICWKFGPHSMDRALSLWKAISNVSAWEKFAEMLWPPLLIYRANNHFHVGPNIAISDTAIIDRGRNVLCKDQGLYATFIILVIRA